MIRILIENIFVFLLPTLVYVGWIAFVRNDWPGLGAVLKAAPLFRLFVLGALLMLATLTLLASRHENKPGQSYVPPSFEGGKFEPGHVADPPPASSR
jgi:hypothetical protein